MKKGILWGLMLVAPMWAAIILIIRIVIRG